MTGPTEMIVFGMIGLGVFAALYWFYGRKPPPDLPT